MPPTSLAGRDTDRAKPAPRAKESSPVGYALPHEQEPYLSLASTKVSTREKSPRDVELLQKGPARESALIEDAFAPTPPPPCPRHDKATKPAPRRPSRSNRPKGRGSYGEIGLDGTHAVPSQAVEDDAEVSSAAETDWERGWPRLTLKQKAATGPCGRRTDRGQLVVERPPPGRSTLDVSRDIPSPASRRAWNMNSSPSLVAWTTNSELAGSATESLYRLSWH